MKDGVRGPGSEVRELHGVWTRKRYLALLLAFAALHCILAMALPLSGDEAYYWDCGRHPDWTYFDQPPLMLWTTRPFCLLLGNTRLAVRAPAIIASFFLGLFILSLLRRLGGAEREAAWIYTVLHGTPLLLFGAWYLSTDIGMMVAYVAAVWAAVAIVQGERHAWWGFGVAVGVGFLAKFSIVLALAALVPVLLRRSSRAHLRTPTPYLAALLCVAITSPVWIWAVQHDWANFTFQLAGRHEFRPWTLRYLAEFIGLNMVLASPPLAVAMAREWWRGWRKRDWGLAAVLAAAIAPFLLFGAYGLREEVAPHWGAPGLVLGVVLLGLARPRPRWLVRSGVAFGVALSAVLIAFALLVSYSLTTTRRLLGEAHAEIADQLAPALANEEVVKAIEQRLRPGELVGSESYTDVHLYAFLSGGRLPTRLGHIHGGVHGLASLFWYRPEELRGRDFLFVTERAGLEPQLAKLFSTVSEEPPYLVELDGHVFRRIRFYRCHDLKHPEFYFSRLPGVSLSR
jgi:4-amino-4-deoxy-L-arabinose transferase-like glycosyltransferase